MSQTPEEREKMLERLAKGREKMLENREKKKEAVARGDILPQVAKPKKRPKNLDKIVREILDDDDLIDKVVANQPEYWQRLPSKSGGYIIATVMMVKAMGGDIKAADWVRKTGFGDKVLLEDNGGFFGKQDFTIQVIPTKTTESISSGDVLESEIKQIEE